MCRQISQVSKACRTWKCLTRYVTYFSLPMAVLIILLIPKHHPPPPQVMSLRSARLMRYPVLLFKEALMFRGCEAISPESTEAINDSVKVCLQKHRGKNLMGQTIVQ